ncbi:hypothetical protein [Sorangium sp. So ce861]|uniref:hypothetical protein n=1 Tax=Sorangium sp. So ce861 TaxID=3133323 RepID=UPI003F5DAF9A
MSRTHDLLILIAAIAAGVAQTGCLAEALESEPAEGQLGSTGEALTSMNRLSMNRLSMNRLSMNRLSMNGLSAGALSPSGSDLSSTELIETPEGRELLAYVIRCALPEGESLSGAHGGVTYTFPGAVGVAPDWHAEPLDPVGQRWVSACLLAHVNGYGVEVPISLRGEHAALETTTTERAQFNAQEAAFYGNLFGSGADQGMYACAGAAVEAQCGATPSAEVPWRSCGAGEGCELSFAAPCRDVAHPEQQACENTSADFVEDCFPEASGPDGWSGDLVKYPEVITVYLERDDFNALYPGCAPLP